MRNVLKMEADRQYQVGNDKAGSSGTPRRESTSPPRSLTSAASVLIAVFAFAAVAVVVFLDELLDLPHLLFGTLRTPFNWPEAGVEVVLVVLIAGLSVHLIDRSEQRRRKAAGALAREKERLAVTLRSIGDGVIATDVEGTITIVNDAAEELTGWLEREGIGKPLSQVFHIINERTRQQCDNPVEKVLETGGVIGLANDTVLVAKDGTESVIADSGAPIRDAQDSVIGVILVFRDMTEQKRGEKAVQEAREYAQSIVQTVREPLVVLDANLRVISANRSFYETFKVTPEKTEGQFIYDLGNRQWDIPRLRELLEQILPENTVFEDCEVEHDFEAGGQRTMLLNARRIYRETNKTEMILLAIEDITERKRMEERIEHLNDVLRAIRNVNQLITREKNRDRLIRDACNTLIETRGYHYAWMALLNEAGELTSTAEAGVGEDFSAMIERWRRQELPPCAQKAMEQAEVAVIEDHLSTCADCPLVRQGVDRRSMASRLEYAGKSYGLLVVSHPRLPALDDEEQLLFKEVATDIAFALHSMEVEESRRRTDEALRESEEKFRLMVSEVKDYAIFMLDPEGRVSSWNEGAQYIKGYSTEEIIGEDFSRFYTREDVEAGKPEEELTEALAQGRFEDEGWRVRKDGSRFLASAVITALRDETGELKGFTKVTRDITERKRTEEELKRHREHLEELIEERTRELKQAQEELARKERLAVLGQLAGGLGHELRNPLGAIKNAAYFLNMAIEEPEPEVKETLGILDNEVATSERIISSLLGFARPKPPTLRKVDINKLVQDVLPRVIVPDNVELATELEPLPITLADPDQLSQVFGNIISNGVQAMSEGGRLAIKSTTHDAGWVEVSIADTGTGMPQEVREKIFEPLFTTKAKGIGLGLAVSKTLVEGNRGTIDVESEVGKGSTFTIRLPAGKGETLA
jgi:PAS domain S-box-containing protein